MAKIVNKIVMTNIANRLACGESLVTICKTKDMPSYRSVTRAVQDDDELWEIYRKGRVLQAEYYSDYINDLAVQPLPESVDNRLLNAEVQRRRLEIDTLKWPLARIQPYGLRDKKAEPRGAVDYSITLSWDNGEVKVG